jgi:hypothetical protein
LKAYVKSVYQRDEVRSGRPAVAEPLANAQSNTNVEPFEAPTERNRATAKPV